MTTLTTADGAIALPALEPPDELTFALDAALGFRVLIAEGTLEYSLAGINRWMNGGSNARENRERYVRVMAVKGLLGGARLPQAEERFADRYQDYLRRTPAARAQLMLVRAHLLAGGRLTGLRPEALAVVRA